MELDKKVLNEILSNLIVKGKCSQNDKCDFCTADEAITNLDKLDPIIISCMIQYITLGNPSYLKSIFVFGFLCAWNYKEIKELEGMASK